MCSAERWVGQGAPRNSVGKWGSGFEGLAVKRMPLSAAAVAEKEALSLVRDKLQGRVGPHHVTCLVEALQETNAHGQDEMVLVTR